MAEHSIHFPDPFVHGRNSTADRAIEILLLFDDANPVMSAAEIASRLTMSRSTTYRYLQTLRSYGLIKEDQRGTFRLGQMIMELARIARIGLAAVEPPPRDRPPAR